ncbi:mitochondrial carrier domain-containing protein [Thamnocephalis sphaerospora]|uniref:Mitochondrial carrier domain-containing protein n=1 Tax=Thamnocephalis sphaerospora TaxID=78915 RepID=A0A4P9XGR1_9FUNG|nr:mitochondrial carrier domain-containing protein [Thamnocephalis sphaerospora]|eukprot:RKP04834.1 mitochondrial carrier domain-containing protein [Thamnocephalis sphaerospora]
MATTTTALAFDAHQPDLLLDEPRPTVASSIVPGAPLDISAAAGAGTKGALAMLEDWLQQQLRENDRLRHSMAGAGAGCSAAIVTCPLDVVKTRLQNQGRLPPGVLPYHGTVDTLRRTWLSEGVRGLYRGLGPTVLGYLPTWAIYFSVYDSCKVYLSKRNGGCMAIAHMLGLC